MEKIWLKSYPEGMPAEIDPSQYRSITHLMEESFRKYADRNAYVCMDKFLTFREVDQMSRQFGAWLQAKGLKPMESLHATFDTDLHDAITEIPAPTPDLQGKVVDVLQEGYYLNDKLIRHAKVIVGK